jgi:nitroreductase
VASVDRTYRIIEQGTAPEPVDKWEKDCVDLFEAMSTCRSIRRYRTDPIDEDVLWKCIEAAGYAPSGSNARPWRIIVVQSEEARALLGPAYRAGMEWSAEIYGISRPDPADNSRKARMTRSMYEMVDHFEEIPMYIVFAAEVQPNLPERIVGVSVYPAMQNFILAARSFGLGTIPTGWFTKCEEELMELLAIPKDWFIAALLPLGVPKGRHGTLYRRPVEEQVYWDSWDVRRTPPQRT